MEWDGAFWAAVDALADGAEIVIDRPRGTAHPRFPDLVYEVDYGYLKNTASMDGEGIDVWVGSEERKRVCAVMCVVDLVKRDSEIKLLLGCTQEEQETVRRTHNASAFMKGILIPRP